MPVKHKTQSGRPDNADIGAIQPTHWNEDHDLDGLLELIDALTPTPNTIFSLDATNQPALIPKSSLVLSDSPAFSGIPTAPTAATSVNSQQIATTAFVQAVVAALIAGAPAALNTLDELAAALGDDANYAATITSLLALKAPLASPAFSGNPTVPNQSAGDTDTSAANTAFVQTAVNSVAIGRCILAKSGANIVLTPLNGNLLTVNGVRCTIPGAGVSLAPTGLTVGTLYYIYATASGGAINALEASTTVPAVDSATGVKIKTGDATRTLVAMVRPITGPAFADSATQRFVRSWYNDPGVNTTAAFTANRTCTSVSPTFAEVNSEIRNEFLCWSGEMVTVSAQGGVSQSATQGVDGAIAFDGTTPEDCSFRRGMADTGGAPFGMTHFTQALSEGYHYATLIGRVDAASTATFQGGGSAGSRTTLKVRTK